MKGAEQRDGAKAAISLAGIGQVFGGIHSKTFSSLLHHDVPRVSLAKNCIMVSYVHVYFSGRVQGVGFRYQTLHVAQGYDVAGYVRNLPDGRVEMEAEGDIKELEEFVRAVEKKMDGFIKSVDRNTGTREPIMKGFAIR